MTTIHIILLDLEMIFLFVVFKLLEMLTSVLLNKTCKSKCIGIKTYFFIGAMKMEKLF